MERSLTLHLWEANLSAILDARLHLKIKGFLNLLFHMHQLISFNSFVKE